jgi:hypothetical protein
MSEIPFPPASFSFLVLSLRAQAEMQLGLMHFGEEEKPQPELPLARHTIDLMAVLVEKTKGNLSMDEQRLLENSLTELRFRYVQVAEEAKNASPPQPSEPASADAATPQPETSPAESSQA